MMVKLSSPQVKSLRLVIISEKDGVKTSQPGEAEKPRADVHTSGSKEEKGTQAEQTTGQPDRINEDFVHPQTDQRNKAILDRRTDAFMAIIFDDENYCFQYGYPIPEEVSIDDASNTADENNDLNFYFSKVDIPFLKIVRESWRYMKSLSHQAIIEIYGFPSTAPLAFLEESSLEKLLPQFSKFELLTMSEAEFEARLMEDFLQKASKSQTPNPAASL